MTFMTLRGMLYKTVGRGHFFLKKYLFCLNAISYRDLRYILEQQPCDPKEPFYYGPKPQLSLSQTKEVRTSYSLEDALRTFLV